MFDAFINSNAFLAAIVGASAFFISISVGIVLRLILPKFTGLNKIFVHIIPLVFVFSVTTIAFIWCLNTSLSEYEREGSYYQEKIEETYNVQVISRTQMDSMYVKGEGVKTGAGYVVSSDGKTYNVYLIEDESEGKASLYKKVGGYTYSLINPDTFKNGEFDYL